MNTSFNGLLIRSLTGCLNNNIIRDATLSSKHIMIFAKKNKKYWILNKSLSYYSNMLLVVNTWTPAEGRHWLLWQIHQSSRGCLSWCGLQRGFCLLLRAEAGSALSTGTQPDWPCSYCPSPSKLWSLLFN